MNSPLEVKFNLRISTRVFKVRLLMKEIVKKSIYLWSGEVKLENCTGLFAFEVWRPAVPSLVELPVSPVKGNYRIRHLAVFN